MKTIQEYEDIIFKGAYNKEISFLGSFERNIELYNDTRPTQLEKYKGYIDNLKEDISKLEKYGGYRPTYETLTSVLKEEMEEEEIEYLEGYQSKIDTVFGQVDELKEQIEVSNKLQNDNLKQMQSGKNQVYVDLEQKRKALEKYSNRITDMCSQYGILTSDIDMDTNVFTPEELGTLYDSYNKYLSKDSSLGNPITMFKEVFPDVRFQLAVIVIMLVLTLTPIFDLFGFMIIAAIVYGQFQQKKRVKYYTVLMGVVFNLHPMEYGWKEISPEQLLPEEIDTDNDERFKGFEIKLGELFNEQEENDPVVNNQKLLQEAEYEAMKINMMIDNYSKEVNSVRSRLLSDLTSIKSEVEEDFEKKKSELKLLGNSYNKSLVFDSNFRLGVHDDIFEEYVDVGTKNLIINPGVSQELLNRFIRVLWANAVLNVKPGLLQTYVYDPNEFGQVLVPYYTNDLAKLLIFKKDGLDEPLKELTDYCQQNMKDMRGKDIFAFNKECEEVGKTPKEYKLLIVMSQPKTFEEQEALKEFLTYSSKYGVFVWLVSPKLMVKNTYYFDRPFTGVPNPYKIEVDKFCSTVTNTLVEGIKSEQTPALLWSEFVDKAIPDDSVWTGCADEYIELYPGFEGGDPTKYKPYTVGNEGNVHIIGVGGTGAGKSVFLNHIISSITRLYDPTEVELWLCDFKGTEFKFYLPNDEYQFMLPHIKACLCTSDGDYATSLFKAIRNMADRRYEVLKEAGQKNMVGYNIYCKQKYKETGDKKWLEKKWPRVLFICDEFQVIFEKADDKNLASINADITQLAKVARAAGVHIFFTSQSMKKTVSDDILQQFSLRFALRCDDEVSMAILGTKNASNIREKNGYLYVRSVEMDLAGQKRYRTPFLNDSDKPGKPSALRLHIKDMYDRAVETKFKFKNVITYEEATKHYISELQDYFKTDAVKRSMNENAGLFFLGQRMAYSDNLAPMNVQLPAQNNKHIFSVFEDYTDFVNFFKSVMVNIYENQEKPRVLINSQVKDFHYLCELDKYCDPSLLPLSDDKSSVYDIKDWVQSLYEKKKESPSKQMPMYIILLGWDKATGFGVDSDVTFRSELNTLLQSCGEMNMHFIFISSSKGAIAQNIIDACQVKIAGRCSEDCSYMLLGTRQASKVYDSMKNGYMFVNVRGEITRVKTYLSEDNREITSDEFIIKE